MPGAAVQLTHPNSKKNLNKKLTKSRVRDLREPEDSRVTPSTRTEKWEQPSVCACPAILQAATSRKSIKISKFQSASTSTSHPAAVTVNTDNTEAHTPGNRYSKLFKCFSTTSLTKHTPTKQQLPLLRQIPRDEAPGPSTRVGRGLREESPAHSSSNSTERPFPAPTTSVTFPCSSAMEEQRSPRSRGRARP